MPDFAAALTHIFKDICTCLFRLTGREPALTPLVIFVQNYVARTAARFQRLHHRWQSGTLPAPRPGRARPRRARPAPAPGAAPAPRPARLRLPRQRAWLLRRDQRFAGLGSQLRHIAEQPDFADFLRAAPQAGRLLRPLLRILSPDPPPPLLALPKRPPPPKPARPPRPEPAPSSRMRPLPAYVRAAVRAWKSRYG